jgi:hypothetical protein
MSLPTTTLQVGRYALAEVINHIAVVSASGTVQAARICCLCRMLMHAAACSYCVLDDSVSMHGQDSTNNKDLQTAEDPQFARSHHNSRDICKHAGLLIRAAKCESSLPPYINSHMVEVNPLHKTLNK